MEDADPQSTSMSIRQLADMEAASIGGGEELFPIGSLEGDETTLGQIIKANHYTEITVSMMTAEVPSPRGGLLDPNVEHLLLVTTELAKITPVPIREGERHEGKEIVGWKIRQSLRPIHVERVNGEAGAIEAAFTDLLRADESAATALLDRLQKRTSSALGAPT